MSGLRAIVTLLLVVTSMNLAEPVRARARKQALTTVEGLVTATKEVAGEGGLATLAVELQVDGEGRARTVLLAPRASCEEIGFEVEEGDRLRARIFVEQSGPAKAHKALNLTRSTMVRLRTLRNVPLWTTTGAWQGGPKQTRPGAAGRSSSRKGAGPGRGPGGPA